MLRLKEKKGSLRITLKKVQGSPLGLAVREFHERSLLSNVIQSSGLVAEGLDLVKAHGHRQPNGLHIRQDRSIR